MKILTIFGTRPEYIRLNILINKLDMTFGRKNHILVDTQQNFDKSLRDYFYSNFKLRKPDYELNSKGSFGQQISNIYTKLEKIISSVQPDKFLVLGDTNSSTGAFIAKRMGVDVYHIEAGNRGFNTKSPEEINRKLIDHISDVHMTYSFRSKDNLINEGIHPKNIFVVGNPITEVLGHYSDLIENSQIIKKLSLKESEYFLATIHRQENVDIEKNIKNIILNFIKISKKSNTKLVLIVHPRLRKKISEFSINTKGLILIEPINFFDFIKLEKNSKCIFTDSGTVQEECSILNKSCVVVRESTERLETIENSRSIVSGIEAEDITRSYELLIKNQGRYNPPLDYISDNFADRALNILISKKPI